MVTLYNVISADGFIAHSDGSEDFIPDELWSKTLGLFRKYDSLIMGRKTYDSMQKYDKKLLEQFENLKIKKIVVSKNSNFIPKQGYETFQSPEEAIKDGSNILVSSGPELNTYLLRKGLVKEIIFWKLLNVEIGTGVQPFFDKLGGAYTNEIERFGLIRQQVYMHPYSRGLVKPNSDQRGSI